MGRSIVFFDFEYTAWPGSRERKWSEPWEHREIIQIAAIRVDAGAAGAGEAGAASAVAETGCFDTFVKPARNPQLSGYITALTGITQAEIDAGGQAFPTALAAFYDFCEQGRLPVYCYGDDLLVLRENCAIHNLPLPVFPAGMYDIRAVFEECGIQTACYTSGTVHQAVGVKFEPAAHNALNDVRSLAVTIRQLLQDGRIHADWVTGESSAKGRFLIG